ncbi:MAG: dihydroorotase [Lachnospiraceae bacterium]|nr:dihydroorotase [Lachnospiraceae bacterium]MDY4969280.1 dihydroorotase [Lachnospiraceae bacterium]
MKLLIKNGHVLNPADGFDRKADVLVEDGLVKQISDKAIDAEDAQVIDAQGLYVMPGFIDLHVHLRDPGLTYKETLATGSMAAARGGFTSICPMPNTKPVTDTPEKVAEVVKRAQTEAVVHVLPVGAVTLGMEGKEVTDVAGMKAAGAVAISEDGKSVMDSAIYAEGMKRAAEAGIPVFAHCEDIRLVRGGVMNAGKKAQELGLPGITNAVEDIIAIRDILLAEETGARLHLCHCSTKYSVPMVEQARAKGLPVSAEVCPHHFAMSEDEITEDHGRFKMNPPLRTKEDVQALKDGIKADIMTCISTDHAPHSAEEKNCSMKKAAFGIVGLETAFGLSVTELVEGGYLTPMELAAHMSLEPAKVIGIPKGDISVGRCADIAIVDFKEKWIVDPEEFASKGKNTPFAGRELTGRVKYTICDGKVVFKD